MSANQVLAFPSVEANGMTLRDYFAAQAMGMALQQYRMDIRLLDNEPLPAWGAGECLSFVAADAYKMADAMMAERSA